MSFDGTRATTDPTPPRQWVDMRTVRAHLGGLSQNTITSYIKAGMPAHQAIKGGRYLFDLAEVDRWICSRWTTRDPGEGAA